MQWEQIINKPLATPITYHIAQLKQNAWYTVTVNGQVAQKIKSDSKGALQINRQMKSVSEMVIVTGVN